MRQRSAREEAIRRQYYKSPIQQRRDTRQRRIFPKQSHFPSITQFSLNEPSKETARYYTSRASPSSRPISSVLTISLIQRSYYGPIARDRETRSTGDRPLGSMQHARGIYLSLTRNSENPISDKKLVFQPPPEGGRTTSAFRPWEGTRGGGGE